MRVLKCIVMLTLLWGGAASAAASKSRNRIQELFIWKVSDKLELNTDVETKFSDMIKHLNEAKTVISNELDSIVQKLETEKDETKTQTLLKQYELAQKKMNELQDKEVTDLKKLLGNKKFAQYLVLKRDITNKMKELLSRTEQDSTDKHMGEPKVIEEK